MAGRRSRTRLWVSETSDPINFLEPQEFRHEFPKGMTVAMVRDCDSEESFHSMDEFDEGDEQPSSSDPPFPKRASYAHSASESDVVVCKPDVSTLGAELARKFTAQQLSWDKFTYTSAVVNTWHLDEGVMEKLNDGNALFGFSCKVGDQISNHERDLYRLVINRTCFEDESTENNVPFINMDDMHENKDVTFFLNSAIYVFPLMTLDDIDYDTFVTPEYHVNCQPAHSTKVWMDCAERGDVDTFRITKTIIPWVFKMTIQFRCSLVPEKDLHELSPLLDGLEVHRAILLERTKREKRARPDMTRKCKSIIVYHQLPGGHGLLVANYSFIINSSIPRFLTGLLDRLGSLGADEVAVTA
ncbi:aspartate aminotransferase [Diplonema papillatum]|nr:aspartate aminotransferase [Diplonema papillatum]